MTDLVFVYGSLLSSIAHPMGERLRAVSTLEGEGTVKGRLYRVTWYPGIVLSERDSERVHGQVYRLYEPATELRWLDDYENITSNQPGYGCDNEYTRRIVSVDMVDRRRLTAWVYVFQKPVTGLEWITDGRWKG